MSSLLPLKGSEHRKQYPMTTGRAHINSSIPTELLREIFLYSIEGNQMKSGQLASVCRHWRSIVTNIASLWSTLRVGSWTETERVALWLQRAYPKKVIIDTQRDIQSPSEALLFFALQNALTSTSQWQELTITSFPPENWANQLAVQVASPMNILKVFHVAPGCVHSSSFAHLLSLVPTEAPLCELRLHPPLTSSHFLQPHWFPVLQNLTALIVNGRDVHDPFELLPTFTQIRIFEADRLRLPLYGPNTSLPLLFTLRKLRLRACSVEWMAGRQFPCLEECAILLPRHWRAVQQRGVQFPSCRKFTYYGYPITTAEYFHVPQMNAMELGSHDCSEDRVYQHLFYLCTLNGGISKLTALHLTLQCSERVFLKVLKYMGPLQELVLSFAYPSHFWRNFLELLAAKPSATDWPVYQGSLRVDYQQWKQWCISQIWQTNVLPHLKLLGIKCPKGFSDSECLDNCILLRVIGWTRALSTPHLEHLKVWEGRGSTEDIVVDYISTGCLDKRLGISGEEYDSMVVRGMVTRCLFIRGSADPLYQLFSTTLFRQLQDLDVDFQDPGVNFHFDCKIPILPYLERIKSLTIAHGIIPAYSLNIELPLTHTLQKLRLEFSTFSWMLGRSFKGLREFYIDEPPDTPEKEYMHEGLQADLSACTTMELVNLSVTHLCLLSCPNLQDLRLRHPRVRHTSLEPGSESIQDFTYGCPCLQTLEIGISQDLGLDSLIQFVFCDAREQGVWRDIRSVELRVRYFFVQTVGHQKHYEKWWKKFTVAKQDFMTVIVRASM